MKYRIVEYENRAGGKRYHSQYRKSFLFGLINYWQQFKYYDHSQELCDVKTGGIADYLTYCEAVNAIKYHKMFHGDKDKKYIHNMSDI
jgi:hypothetical protein